MFRHSIVFQFHSRLGRYSSDRTKYYECQNEITSSVVPIAKFRYSKDRIESNNATLISFSIIYVNLVKSKDFLLRAHSHDIKRDFFVNKQLLSKRHFLHVPKSLNPNEWHINEMEHKIDLMLRLKSQAT